MQGKIIAKNTQALGKTNKLRKKQHNILIAIHTNTAKVPLPTPPISPEYIYVFDWATVYASEETVVDVIIEGSDSVTTGVTDDVTVDVACGVTDCRLSNISNRLFTIFEFILFI